jgi:hypothetical protein
MNAFWAKPSPLILCGATDAPDQRRLICLNDIVECDPNVNDEGPS